MNLTALAACFGLLCAEAAHAGMPAIGLADVQRALQPSELAKGRLDAISFFGVGLLVVAASIRWVWNALRKDFPVLPRLSYLRALGLVFLWSLLFVLVLTMISGARELLTPGAWEKADGAITYKLTAEGTPVERLITERVRAIERFREALTTYSNANEIPASTWIVPGTDGARYVYYGGKWAVSDDDFSYSPKPIAYEPEAVGPDRLVLNSHKEICWWSVEEIERRVRGAKP